MKAFKALLLSVFIIISLIFTSQAKSSEFDYQPYAGILKKYVHEGKIVKGIKLNVVDYEDFYRESKDPSSDYARYLKSLSRFNPADLTSKNDRIAFWINAYNLGAIKMILDHYPVDSIRSIKISFFRNPWKKKILNINGRLYSLYEIEHEILLGKYKAKMAHFAIVCASLSCPDLSKEVYLGETLTSQLERQARLYLNNPQKGVLIKRDENKVFVSKIFKWDKKSFGAGKKDIIPFILPFIEKEEDINYLEEGSYKIHFLDYDWDLNAFKSVK